MASEVFKKKTYADLEGENVSHKSKFIKVIQIV